MLEEALTPLADGVAIAPQFSGDLEVGRVVVSGGAQDDAAAESESLGGGTRPSKGFELGAKFVSQFDGRSEGARHGCPPVGHDKGVRVGLEDIMVRRTLFG
jgi:hypothetical protein